MQRSSLRNHSIKAKSITRARYIGIENVKGWVDSIADRIKPAPARLFPQCVASTLQSCSKEEPIVMKKLAVVLALVVTFSTSFLRPSQALFDKTRFATDLGVAFYAFHHWVFAPYRQGAFSSGASHRTKS